MQVNSLARIASKELVEKTRNLVFNTIFENTHNANKCIHGKDRDPERFQQWIRLALAGIDFKDDFLRQLANFAWEELEENIEKEHLDWDNGDLFDVIYIDMKHYELTLDYGNHTCSITDLIIACMHYPVSSVNDTLFKYLVETMFSPRVSARAQERFKRFPLRIFTY